jgi:asparagine synthase (glutamine-hydrolysing)
MISPDRRLMLSHNGEFYDYKRIRADLTSRGRRFRSRSDSELVLHLYEVFGLEGMLPHLRGEFAFALYDSKEDKLILVRDRFGIKPLYWTNTGKSVIFGSEIKVIFSHPDVNRQFGNSGLYHQLMQTMVPGTTPFENVHQVKPGHALIIQRRNGSFHVEDKRYWDMDFPRKDERGEEKSEEFYIEAIREKLTEAVIHRLEADVPVGCYLSGGIDSCSILGLSAAAQQSPVKAFTISFDSDDYDESAIAKEMAATTEADHDIMPLAASHLYDNFVETHWHTERTIYNTLGVAKLLMSRHVRDAGYRVVVTGEGSDELFGGYPAFRRDMFLHGLDDMDPAERETWQKMLDESNRIFKGAMLAQEEWKDPSLEELCGFTPSSLQPWLSASVYSDRLIQKDRKMALGDYSPGEAIASQLDADMIKGRHPLDIAQYVWIKTMLEGQILTWGGDRVDMANSMEARPAFLDHHLAETARHLPPSMRIKGRVEKYVLREAMKGLLPEVLYKREKFAFMAPPAHTDPAKFNAMKALADDYLSTAAINDAGLLDERQVREIFRVHEEPNTPASTLVQLDAVINHMLGVQILHRNMITADIPGLAREKARSVGWSVEKGDLAARLDHN